MDIKQETKNRWPGIYRALGIDVGKSGHHCACPICGPGRNNHRFRMDDKDGTGTWICTQCGAGDGFSLVMKVLHVDFKEAVKEIKKVLGTADITKPQAEKKISKELLRKIYTESKLLITGDPVSMYLKNRGLSVTSEKLRYHPSCYEPETHSKMPAMLATYTLPDGTAITIHRTFLTKFGNKADIQNPKKVLPALQGMSGGAIRLFEPKDGMIAVAEGIETALAVYELTKIPTWAMVSSTLMEKFEPPKGIKYVMIFGDHDFSYVGARAAYILANNLYKKGIKTEVKIPIESGTDWLDYLTAHYRHKEV